MPSSCAAVNIALLILLGPQFSFAQTAAVLSAATATAAAPQASSPAKSRPDKASQRIRTEDAGTRIDELRLGGETQNITVQPKTGNPLPAYEVKPSDATKGSLPAATNNDTNGARVWNVLKF